MTAYHAPVRIAKIFFCLVLLVAVASAKDTVQKQTLKFTGDDRTYYLFVPENAKSPAPLLLLLHGSGRNGRIMIDQWKELATKEGIVLVAPDARNPARWGDADGPPFLHLVIEAVRGAHAIDARRMYIFGHSAGAVMGLLISMLESQYFAATAVHAGAIPPEARHFVDVVTRRIPIRIFVGTDDPYFPLKVVRDTRDLLVAKGFPVELIEMAHHTHDYYSRAAEINVAAWEFLKKFTVAEPRYEDRSVQ